MLRAAALVVVSLLTITACDDAPSSSGASSTTTEQAPSRFNAPKKVEAASKAATSFCEKTFPAGEGGKRFVAPAEKPLPDGTSPAPWVALRPSKMWTWVNLWATWCHPCVEEMGLLAQWEKALAKDGLPIGVELYSVDDGLEDLVKGLKKPMPGTIRWLKGGANDLPAVLESWGVDKNSPIPVHALVDGNGMLRCVRVGSVHIEDYAAIKSIISGN